MSVPTPTQAVMSNDWLAMSFTVRDRKAKQFLSMFSVEAGLIENPKPFGSGMVTHEMVMPERSSSFNWVQPLNI